MRAYPFHLQFAALFFYKIAMLIDIFLQGRDWGLLTIKIALAF